MKALTGAIVLSKKLRKTWSGQEKVGILLPQCWWSVDKFGGHIDGKDRRKS